LLNLARFEVVVPDQVRRELNNNLDSEDMRRFYALVRRFNVRLSYEQVPDIYITMFYDKGLKKGDAIIGGFAEWQKIEAIVSDNRDFLRGLAAGHTFEVLSPEEFCNKIGL
jgi:hypothetical protein